MPGADLISSLDLLLRGGAALLLLLVGALLLRDHRELAAARLGAAFALGSGAFAICSQAGLHALLGMGAIPFLALAAGNNLVFWLFARGLFDDGFRLRPWHGLIWALIVGAALVYRLILQPRGLAAAGPVHTLLSLETIAFALAAALQTLSSWREDLVEPRRRLRLFVVVAAAGNTLAGALTGLVSRGPIPPAVDLVQAAVLAAIAGTVAWSLTRIADDGALFAPAGQTPAFDGAPPSSAGELAPVDRKLVAGLEHLMQIDRLYRQEGLTIGRLANLQGLPEYRLRRLINQGLGHRNFASFLNGYRIADAMAALGDPDQAEVPILTIALDAGFNSLGPFNRAFKAETGLTPTEYRARAESSPVPIAASRISNSAGRRPAPAP